MSANPSDVVAVLASEASLVDVYDDVKPAPETLRCHPDLIAHLEEFARACRSSLVYVAGCPVLIDRGTGLPFAAAWGSGVLVLRLGLRHPGVLAREGPKVTGLDEHWWAIDPWPQDFTFQRGKDLLRNAVAAAAATRRA